MSILRPAAPSVLYKRFKTEGFFLAMAVIGAVLGTGEVMERYRLLISYICF